MCSRDFTSLRIELAWSHIEISAPRKMMNIQEYIQYIKITIAAMLPYITEKLEKFSTKIEKK